MTLWWALTRLIRSRRSDANFDAQTHNFMGLAAGSLIGSSVLLLLPEASELANPLTVRACARALRVVGDRRARGQAKHASLVIVGLVVSFVTDHFTSNHHHFAHTAQETTAVAASSSLQLAEISKQPPGGDSAVAVPSPSASTKKAALVALAWTSVFGELVHNFVDGALIGIAFLASSRVGLTSTIAIVLHEIPQVCRPLQGALGCVLTGRRLSNPQEVGDFALYLRAGLSFKAAMGLNILSALSAYVGAVLILGLSEKFREEMETATIYLLLFAVGERVPRTAAPSSPLEECPSRRVRPAQASSSTWRWS